MTIACKKVRIQPPQIQRDHPNPMRPINDTQDTLLPTNLRQALKRKPNAGVTNHDVENGNFNIQPLRSRITDRPQKPFH